MAVLCVVAPCSLMNTRQRFWGPRCHHHQCNHLDYCPVDGGSEAIRNVQTGLSHIADLVAVRTSDLNNHKIIQKQSTLHRHRCIQLAVGSVASTSLPLIVAIVYGTNQANWRSWKWDFPPPLCMELRALTNYCSRSIPLWQNYDSTRGVWNGGRFWGWEHCTYGCNASFVFMRVCVRL